MTKDEEAKAAADKAAADKAAADKAAADKAAADKLPELKLYGRAGAGFSLYGNGFGPSGSLTVGGVAVTSITRWDDGNVRGTLPDGAKGEVVLTPGNGAPVRRGVFPVKVDE